MEAVNFYTEYLVFCISPQPGILYVNKLWVLYCVFEQYNVFNNFLLKKTLVINNCSNLMQQKKVQLAFLTILNLRQEF